MPVYHFTLHAYGTYLPDNDAGSYHWRRGFQIPKKDGLAKEYRHRQREQTVCFTSDVQDIILDELRVAADLQTLRLFGAACASTHVHLVVAWEDETRDPVHVRVGVKSSVTRRLNKDVKRRTWLSALGAPRRVWVRDHLVYLMTKYLPSHSGRQWYEHRSSERGPGPRCDPA